MNAELPPLQNGEHNSKSASTIDRVMAPLTWQSRDCGRTKQSLKLGIDLRLPGFKSSVLSASALSVVDFLSATTALC